MNNKVLKYDIPHKAFKQCFRVNSQEFKLRSFNKTAIF